MIDKQDLRWAISRNAEVIDERLGEWYNQLYTNLKKVYTRIDARQVYWNILALIAIKTGGRVEFNPKISFDINLIIDSEPIYVSMGDWNTPITKIQAILKEKGVLPEIIDRLKILRVQ